jgi:hypothetical protein
MKQIVREPLVHFIALGAGLFLIYGLTSEQRSTSKGGEILVTQGRIEHLVSNFAKAWQRPPTQEEVEGLIRDWVREEVYSREAIAMGLDQDDTIIRRRLRQKMEFFSTDIASTAEPTDVDLNAYLQAHAEKFLVPARFDFSQVYFNPERHSDSLARDTAQLMEQLRQAGEQADVSALGDPFLLEHAFTSVPLDEVAKLFGDPFAVTLGELQVGQWQGPIESGFGLHLVFLSHRTEGHAPTLTEVRDGVRREWESARRLETSEKFYQALLDRYVVTVEGPKSNLVPKRLAEARSN